MEGLPDVAGPDDEAPTPPLTPAAMHSMIGQAGVITHGQTQRLVRKILYCLLYLINTFN